MRAFVSSFVLSIIPAVIGHGAVTFPPPVISENKTIPIVF